MLYATVPTPTSMDLKGREKQLDEVSKYQN